MMISLLLSLLAAQPAAAAPCDLYASRGTPCVAAHSTTRALYSSYTGSLYQVVRASDGLTVDITPITAQGAARGIANSAVQDTFCAQTTCLISIIYDQSGKGNDLRRGPGGAFDGPEADYSDHLASANGAPVTLNGHRVYGVFISPGTGYRIDNAKGIAIGDQPEGMYAVLDGTHYNDVCCFDYGNAETSDTDTGPGHMEAIYYGNNTFWGSGAGSGPWIMADLEDGLFSGHGPKVNTGDPSLSYRFVTAVTKGRPGYWSIRGGDSQSTAKLSTYYSGSRPSGDGYDPMNKEGAIVLGIGGDNSNGGQGTFYEGVMTNGYPSDAADDAVQADVAAAKYATTSPNDGPALTVGASVSFRPTAKCCTTRYMIHGGPDSGGSISFMDLSTYNQEPLKRRARWTVRAGLANSACYSFESFDTPGSFLRHYEYRVVLRPNDGSKQFGEDATFCTSAGLNGQGNSIRSWNDPTRLWRLYFDGLFVGSNGGVYGFDGQAEYNDDVSWAIVDAYT
ncbi:hypothetical protein E4U12_005065 [Claviceps purpurea]|nr:hypothetical protein E4U12_005065 [Claviceps purpurea]